jgi:hypothetical protein
MKIYTDLFLRLDKTITELNKKITTLELKYSESKKEITDTERLDFIEKHGFSFDRTLPCKPLREAIDAAMRKKDE